MPRSTNRPSRGAEPEVWFRVVHASMHSQNPVSDAETPVYREQTVEIALGPKGAFENGNVGAVTRRVEAEMVVNSTPRRPGKPKPPREPRTPRVVELLRKAIEWQALLESGEASNQAAIARNEGVTRARVTQIMGLLRLTPEIQEHVLAMPKMLRRPTITERSLRPIAQRDNVTDQKTQFDELIG